jgi:hypothetical protein
MEGTHITRKGNRADGKTVAVPLYRHQIAMDYTRVELELLYQATAHWDFVARLPWERKVQSSSFRLIEAASAEQIAAMARNIDIHHRSGVTEGVSDATLLGRRHDSSLFRTGDAFMVSAGVSLPTGKTVENPYILGSQGIEHSHIQFGSGTVDPIFESWYVVPARGAVSAAAFVSARWPLYENSHTFKAAPDSTVSLSVMRPIGHRVNVRAEAMTYVQGYGYWDGVRDENMTGLLSTSAGLGAAFRIGGAALSIDARYPIAQRTLLPGDTFKRGTTVILGVSGLAR